MKSKIITGSNLKELENNLNTFLKDEPGAFVSLLNIEMGDGFAVVVIYKG